MSQTVGFIGLGLMGKPMARNLLKKGFSVIVHNRSRGAVEELVSDGATAAGSPAEVARAARHIITMLPDGPDVSNVLEGESGVFEGFGQALHLPAERRQFAAEGGGAGVAALLASHLLK